MKYHLQSLFFIFPSLVFCQELPFFVNLSSQNLPEIVLQPTNTMDMRVGDVNSDGYPDLVLAVEFFKNIILINDGTGKFLDGSHRLPDKKAVLNEDPYPYYPYHDSEDVALEDFDNDGDLDILIVTEDDETNEYYLNDGKGYFDDVSHQLPVKGVSNAVIAHDFDNDGWIDVMIGNNGQNYYLKNDHGKFLNETNGRLPLRNDITQDLEAYDFDKDGDLDLIVANEHENYLLINDGTGKFEDATAKYINKEYRNGETREADFADINGDGEVDLYFANVHLFQKYEPVQSLLININGEFVDETLDRLGFTDLHSVLDADFVDIDNDGDLDLFYQTFERPRIFLNDGKGYFKDITENTFPELRGMGIDIEVADFNGDGLMDIYFGNFKTGDNLLLQVRK